MIKMEISISRQQSRDNLEQSWLPYRRLLKFISQLTHLPSDLLNNYARTIFFLILLGLIFPLHLLITLLTCISSNFRTFIQHKKSISIANAHSKRILISGGRMTAALHLCRSFSHAGHQIILIDESKNWLTGHRWSNSVERFYVHPSPIYQSDAYITTLANIVRKEKIDIFIPLIPFYNPQIDAQIKSALAVHGCSVFHNMTYVDHKYAFIEKARSLDLTVPKTILITSRNQLLDFDFDNEDCLFICKSILSNHFIKLPRLTHVETIEYINKLSITEDNPYILQEWISGEEYSTCGVCIDGELTLFTCSHSSSWQLNSKHIEHPEILQWCLQYIQALKLTGHISFDFIVNDKDRKAYAIKCHPSINSMITKFYNHPNLVDAYFPQESLSLISPLITAREIYWFPDEIWRICHHIRSIKKSLPSLKRILFGKEAIWFADDPLPFLFHYHIHIFYLLVENLFTKHIRFIQKIDCSIGKLV